jgi:hypothetical protein
MPSAAKLAMIKKLAVAPFAELTSNPKTKAVMVATKPIASLIVSLESAVK